MPWAVIYIDDILVASPTAKQHTQHLHQLFDRLQQYGLTIHHSKCVLGVSNLDFVGHRVTPEGIMPLPQKVEAIRDFPTPTTAQKLREFFGGVNYYHRFVPRAVEALAPLHDLLWGYKKGSQKALKWTQAATTAFDTVKPQLALSVLLAYPQPHAPTSLYTDALSEAVGAGLQQEINRVLQPIACFSKCLEPSQRKYSAFDRKLLAAYKAVRHF